MKQILLILVVVAFGACRSDERLRKDWASMKRYAADNARLLSDTSEHRVVLMGNSIIESWGYADPGFFRNNAFINRGISGQTTSQMLVRFRQDVIELRPKAVLILAGTNDIAENTGPVTVEKIAGNIFSMAELARNHGIEPVLCSTLPVEFYYWKKNIDPVPKIKALNQMIRNYCDSNNLVYIDFYALLVNKESGLDWKFTADGVHPNAEGYAVMRSITEKAISSVLHRAVVSQDQLKR